MISQKDFESDLIMSMRQELRKQASGKIPDLVKAAECLHAALEIFEQAGLQSRADDVLKLLEKIAQHKPPVPRSYALEMPSISKLMEHGIKQRDLVEFSKGNPVAIAKFNLVLRRMGLPEHQIAKVLGHKNLMSEKDATDIINPNRSFSKIQNWLQNPTGPDDPNKVEPGNTLKFKSIAQDRHTKGLTPEKMVENLKHHGTEFNMADIMRSDKLSKADMDPELADLLDADSFDIDASDDELLGLEIKDDSLEVFDRGDALSDFEDERD